MAIKVDGKLADHLVAGCIGVAMQEGWDAAKKWLRAQGVFAVEHPPPQKLPAIHPFSYFTNEFGYFCYHFVDPQKGVHMRLRYVVRPTPYGPQLMWESW